MSQDHITYSDEMLNAYLDNELASEDRRRLIEDLRENDGLRERVCRLEQIRNMVSIAYHDLPEAKHNLKIKSRGASAFTSIAAGILVVVGIIGGWFGHTYMQQDNGSLVKLADNVFLNDPASRQQTWRVLLHVTSDDPYRLNILLNETENILREYQARQQKVMVEVLANGSGLNLLRSDKSVFSKRIAKLQSEYDGLVFLACAQAMSRVQKKTGKTVELLPGTHIAPSAIGEVLRRQREGWTYIKI